VNGAHFSDYNKSPRFFEQIKALAGLPSKEQLIAQVTAQLLSPVNDITNGLSGNLHALLDGIEAKATN